jgi:hypothetical protein
MAENVKIMTRYGADGDSGIGIPDPGVGDLRGHTTLGSVWLTAGNKWPAGLGWCSSPGEPRFSAREKRIPRDLLPPVGVTEGVPPLPTGKADQSLIRRLSLNVRGSAGWVTMPLVGV